MANEGFPIVHQSTSNNVPMVSNRSCFTCFYHLKDEYEVEEVWGEGKIPSNEKERFEKGFTYLVSSRGNEMFEEMFAESITGKDVMATLFYDYIKVTPSYDKDGKLKPDHCNII